jgi:D-beta-D-heptose 7-phosphate kinase/D-beta-D-heptose 1-phosphate adenosyltransferase
MSQPTLKGIAGRFAGRRVLILGDLMLDEYVWGKARRISPEAPVPVVEFERRTYECGGAANTAANVLGLRGRVLLAGVTGADPPGDVLRTLLRERGMDDGGVLADPERLTTTKTRILANQHQIVRVDCEHQTPIAPPVEEAVVGWVERHAGDVDAFVLSDYGKGVVSARLAQRVILAARQAGKPLVVDPKGTDYARYRGATLVKPNLLEAEHCFNRPIRADADLHEAGRQFLDLLPGSAVLITRGGQGMSLFRPGLRPLHIPSLARRVFDGTGAGDTVTGTLALALAAGATLEQACLLATQAAGIVVGKLGTAPVTLEELLDEARLPGGF